MADTKKYTVTGTNIKHNGKTYEAGAQIELTDDEAEKLKKYLTEGATADSKKGKK